MIVSMIESLIDFVPNDDGLYTPIPGGSPYNSAVALGRLGANVAFCGNISNDFFGNLLIKYLDENAVSTKFINRVENSTTLAFVSYDENKQPHYSFYANDTADISFNTELPKLPQEVNCLLFGSYSIALEPSGSYIEKIISNQMENYIIALDPNLRLTIAKNKKTYKERIHRLITKSTILKLSIEDFSGIYDKNYTANEILIYLQKHSDNEIIFLTDGEKGSYALTKKDVQVYVPALKIDKLVDTVGAGDAFFSAILIQLEKYGYLKKSTLKSIDEKTLTAIMHFASIVSGINCTKQGANAPTLEEVNTYIENYL